MNEPIMFRGIVRGNSVVFSDDVGLAEGQEVVVSLQMATTTPARKLESLKRAIGSWKDEGQELDEFLEWTRQQRKIERRDPLS